MNNLGLVIKDNKILVNSQDVARVYGKQHRNVLRAIKDLLELIPECQLNFELASYSDGQEKNRPMYNMDRQGFSMLVLGFTGAKAKRFTFGYTKAFETMSKMLEEKPKLTAKTEGLEFIKTANINGTNLELFRRGNSILAAMKEVAELLGYYDTSGIVKALKRNGMFEDELYTIKDGKYRLITQNAMFKITDRSIKQNSEIMRILLEDLVKNTLPEAIEEYKSIVAIDMFKRKIKLCEKFMSISSGRVSQDVIDSTIMKIMTE